MFSIRHSIAFAAVLVLAITIMMITSTLGHNQVSAQSSPNKPAQSVNVINEPTVIVGNSSPIAVHTSDTHVGRPTSDLVTLNRLGGGSLQRVSGDGVAEGTEFTVPAGQVFVATDLSWTAGGDPASVAGNTATFRLLNGPSIVHLATSTLGSNGQGGSSESMTTGVVYSAGSHVRWLTTTAGAFDVTVHGYLIAAN